MCGVLAGSARVLWASGELTGRRPVRGCDVWQYDGTEHEHANTSSVETSGQNGLSENRTQLLQLSGCDRMDNHRSVKVTGHIASVRRAREREQLVAIARRQCRADHEDVNSCWQRRRRRKRRRRHRSALAIGSRARAQVRSQRERVRELPGSDRTAERGWGYTVGCAGSAHTCNQVVSRRELYLSVCVCVFHQWWTHHTYTIQSPNKTERDGCGSTDRFRRSSRTR